MIIVGLSATHDLSATENAFLQHFCIFLQLMCDLSKTPPPPFFSNFHILCCLGRVLYSSHTYALSGCTNVPTNRPISAHPPPSPCPLANPAPHYPAPSSPPPTRPAATPTRPHPAHQPNPARPRPARHSIPTDPTRAHPGPRPPQKTRWRREDWPADVWHRGRREGGVQRREGGVRSACSGVRAVRGLCCSCVGALCKLQRCWGAV